MIGTLPTKEYVHFIIVSLLFLHKKIVEWYTPPVAHSPALGDKRRLKEIHKIFSISFRRKVASQDRQPLICIDLNSA